MTFVGLWGTPAPSARALDLLDALRADLAAAPFTVEALERLWADGSGGEDVSAALQRGHRMPALRVLAEQGDRAALPVLARLLVLGGSVRRDALDAALPLTGAAGAEELGLIAPAPDAGGAVRALVDLRPYSFVDSLGPGRWWLASDPGELAVGGALAPDHVLGVGGASLTLAGLLLQRPAERVLDLGTGSGILALHSARHAARVVATDLSARALAFARFTLLLNRVEGVELRHGSLFDPVAGERFDRIVSNPPFVITPRDPGVPEYDYRDGGMVGDGLVEAVLRDVARHLRPGGIAQLLGNWEDRDDVDGLERVRAWLEESGLEYWVVERERQDPSEYAETWIRDGGTRSGTREFEALHAAWLRDFHERGVTGIGFGYLLLRMPAASAAPRLRRIERLHGPLGDNPAGLGAHLDACLGGWDGIAELDDPELGAVRMTVAPDVTEERHHWPGSEEPAVILLRQGGGFARTVQAGTGLAALVGACDGELALLAIVRAIAELTGVDADALWIELAPVVRELVIDGLLVPDASPRNAPDGLTVPLHV